MMTQRQLIGTYGIDQGELAIWSYGLESSPGLRTFRSERANLADDLFAEPDSAASIGMQP
jgi:hypothetical protein